MIALLTGKGADVVPKNQKMKSFVKKKTFFGYKLSEFTLYSDGAPVLPKYKPNIRHFLLTSTTHPN